MYMAWIFKTATKPAATPIIWGSLLKPKTIKNNIKETSSESKANTNVILTTFEQSVLEKLRIFDEQWVLIKDCTKEDIYSKTIIEKIDDEWNTIKVSFLNFKGRFIWPATWTKLNVTLVVTDDSRFYMSLGNKEIKDAWGQDTFINHLEHMQEIYFATNWYSLSPEQIQEEFALISSL